MQSNNLACSLFFSHSILYPKLWVGNKSIYSFTGVPFVLNCIIKYDYENTWCWIDIIYKWKLNDYWCVFCLFNFKWSINYQSRFGTNLGSARCYARFILVCYIMTGFLSTELNCKAYAWVTRRSWHVLLSKKLLDWTSPFY